MGSLLISPLLQWVDRTIYVYMCIYNLFLFFFPFPPLKLRAHLLMLRASYYMEGFDVSIQNLFSIIKKQKFHIIAWHRKGLLFGPFIFFYHLTDHTKITCLFYYFRYMILILICLTVWFLHLLLKFPEFYSANYVSVVWL